MAQKESIDHSRCQRLFQLLDRRGEEHGNGGCRERGQEILLRLIICVLHKSKPPRDARQFYDQRLLIVNIKKKKLDLSSTQRRRNKPLRRIIDFFEGYDTVICRLNSNNSLYFYDFRKRDVILAHHDLTIENKVYTFEWISLSENGRFLCATYSKYGYPKSINGGVVLFDVCKARLKMRGYLNTFNMPYTDKSQPFSTFSQVFSLGSNQGFHLFLLVSGRYEMVQLVGLIPTSKKFKKFVDFENYKPGESLKKMIRYTKVMFSYERKVQDEEPFKTFFFFEDTGKLLKFIVKY